MIRSFKNKLTASIDDGSVKKGFPADLVRRAQQLLTILDAATTTVLRLPDPLPIVTLGFEGPSTVVASSASSVTRQYACTLTHSGADSGPRGWSFGVAAGLEAPSSGRSAATFSLEGEGEGMPARPCLLPEGEGCPMAGDGFAGPRRGLRLGQGFQIVAAM